jgi:hypothetical protein
MSKTLFRAIDVWQRVDDHSIKRYRCFQILPDNGYCVQSLDFYNLPHDTARAAFLDRQFLELFAEQSPDQRTPVFPTLEEAIQRHDRHFAGSSN